MLEMNPEVRALWTKALRDGTRVQGTGKLHYQDPADGVWKQCCLGVLCELAAEAGVVDVETATSNYHLYDDEFSLLPSSVRIWAGLDKEDPYLRPFIEGDEGYDHEREADSQGEMSCVAANDDEDLTFLDIADLIDGGEDAVAQQA